MKSLYSKFQGFSIRFVKREAKKAAHAYARAALSIDTSVVSYDSLWISSPQLTFHAQEVGVAVE